MASAMHDAQHGFTWWRDPVAAGTAIGRGLTDRFWGAGSYPIYGPDSSLMTPGARAPAAGPNPYVAAMGQGLTAPYASGPDYAGAMDTALIAPYKPWNKAMEDITVAVQRSTDARGVDALGAAVGGAGLGTVVGIAAGGPAGAVIGPVIDKAISVELPGIISSLLGAPGVLFDALPEMVGEIASKVFPDLISQHPELLAIYAVSLGPEIAYAIVGSVDEIGQALLDALLDLPRAFAEEIAVRSSTPSTAAARSLIRSHESRFEKMSLRAPDPG